MPVARGPKGRVDQLRQGLSENGRVSDSQLPRNTPWDELHRLTVYREQWHSLHVSVIISVPFTFKLFPVICYCLQKNIKKINDCVLYTYFNLVIGYDIHERLTKYEIYS